MRWWIWVAMLASCKAAAPRVLVIEEVEPRILARNTAVPMRVSSPSLGGPTLLKDSPKATLFIERTRDIQGNAVTGPSVSTPVDVLIAGGRESLYLTLTLGPDAPAGIYGVRVLQPSGDVAKMPAAFALLPPAQLSTSPESAACTGTAGASISVGASNLPIIDGKGPAASVASSWGTGYATSPVLTGCTPVPFDRLPIQLCTGLSAALHPGLYGDGTLLVSLPGPPDPTQAPLQAAISVDMPHPLPEWQQPVFAPVNAPVNVVVAGSPFLTSAGTTAAFDGLEVTPDLQSCKPAAVPGYQWCSSNSFAIPQGTPAGVHTASINTLSGCSIGTKLEVTGAPSIAAVSSRSVCARDPAGVRLSGAGFVSPVVRLGTSAFPTAGCAPGPAHPTPACSEVTFRPFVPAGTWPIALENSTAPPVAVTAGSLQVLSGPPTLSAPVPSVVYAGLQRSIFVGLSDVTGQVQSVELLAADGGSVPAASVAPAYRGEQLGIPAGLPPGPREIVVHDDSPACPGRGRFLDLRASFVAFSEDFETGPGEVQVYWPYQTGTPGPTLERVPRATGGWAVHSQSSGPLYWAFGLDMRARLSWDLGMLRFDLRRTGTGAPVQGPDVRLLGGMNLLGLTLSPPPSDTWTHYDIRLDDPAGWALYHDVQDHWAYPVPATADELRAAVLSTVEIDLTGQQWDGTSEASLDNLVLELVH